MTESSKSFPDCHADELRRTFRERGAEGVVAFALDPADPAQRRQLFALAHRVLGCADGHAGNLDGYVTVLRCAFDEFLRQAAEEQDPVEARKRTDGANILAFNFAAALAECWPEDGTPRCDRHFREGLHAAERALAWRRDLGKAPQNFALAWWAKGVHELSLGRFHDAAQSFESSREQAVAAAAAEGRSADVGPGGDFHVLIGEGYRGLALDFVGDPEGKGFFRAACAAFEAAAAGTGDEADDARFGLAQLQCMRERLASRFGPATAD
jgi:hypothetical protein